MKIRDILAAAGIILLLSLAGGCADMFVTKTRLIYESPEGRKIDLTAGKDYEDVDVEWETKSDGTVKARARIGSAGTPSAAIAAANRLSLKLLEMLERLEPILQKGAAAGT